MTLASPRPCSTSHAVAAAIASTLPRPSSQPELMWGPSPVKAPPAQSAGRSIVSTMGSPKAVAKSQSRWSSPGTAMIAPVP